MFDESTPLVQPSETVIDSLNVNTWRDVEYINKYVDLAKPENLNKIDALAAAHYKAGKYKDAEDLLMISLNNRSKNLGDAHPDTLLTMGNLAAAVARNGKRQEAEDLFRRCLAGREVQLGFNHIDTLTTVNHLAVLLKQMGRFKEADVLFQRALIGLSEGLGPHHLFTAECCYNYAIMCVQLGKRKKAATLFAQAHKGLAGSLGSEHQHTLDALSWEIRCAKCLDGVAEEFHDKFVSKDLWKTADVCEICDIAFTLFKRQHHCRACARYFILYFHCPSPYASNFRSVCHECSKFSTFILEFDPVREVRICCVCEQQGL